MFMTYSQQKQHAGERRGVIVLFLFLCLVSIVSSAHSQPTPPSAHESKASSSLTMQTDEDAPTLIKSDSLELQAEERVFYYRGNVEVRQGDLILTSQELQGRYNENNEIETLTALRSVFITKGEGIKARGEKAVYTKASETVVLTDNPELQQEGSVLSADSITIFLLEDRSVAEGTVRVKLVNDEKSQKGPQQVGGPAALLQ